MREECIVRREGWYLREPRWSMANGRAWLHVLAWKGDVERHEMMPFVDGRVDIDAARVVTERPAIAGLSWSDVPDVVEARVAHEIDCVARASGPRGIERVRVEHRGGGESRVVLERHDCAIELWRAVATASAPAIACVAEGSWIAFHHNLREEEREPDLAKWIALRFVDANGNVLEPRASMPDRDRDATGEDQGFEFPTIAAGPDGAIAIFGRASHTFYRQDLSACGWSARQPLDDGSWGCRGRRVAVVEFEGKLLSARRDRRGIVIGVEALPSGGAPELAPAEVVIAARPHRDVPRRARGSDPALRFGLRTFFGDIHQHSAHSDGCGSAHEPYLRARWVYGDDFAALSDHESFLGKRIGPGEWAHLRAVADHHNSPGEFVTLHAYEWTGRAHPGPGHKVVYPRSSEHRIVSRDDEPTGRGLIARLRDERAIAVPHHVGWTGADEDAHDEAVQPVWEICSCHGCYLEAGHVLGQRGALADQMIHAVLSRGRRFGFIACSDGHGLLFHHGVGRKRDPFRCGLTAVQAEALTRSAILDALVARRSYATSGVPIYLDLRVDGSHPMGSVLRRGAGPSRYEVRAIGVEELREVALVGPDGVLARTEPRSFEGGLVAELGAPWIYARVTQADGEMAWSSPVFVADASPR